MMLLMMRQVRVRERHPEATPRRGVTALFVMASLPTLPRTNYHPTFYVFQCTMMTNIITLS